MSTVKNQITANLAKYPLSYIRDLNGFYSGTIRQFLKAGIKGAFEDFTLNRVVTNVTQPPQMAGTMNKLGLGGKIGTIAKNVTRIPYFGIGVAFLHDFTRDLTNPNVQIGRIEAVKYGVGVAGSAASGVVGTVAGVSVTAGLAKVGGVLGSSAGWLGAGAGLIIGGAAGWAFDTYAAPATRDSINDWITEQSKPTSKGLRGSLFRPVWLMQK